MNNKGQITIFVIVAVILVVVIAMFFLIDRKPRIQRGQDFDNPESYVDDCVKDKLNDLTDVLLANGGLANPTDYVLYEGSRVTYLCKNVNYYQPCINQHPRYISEIQDEINENLEADVEQCFSILENELQNRNYDVSGGDIEVDSELKEDFVEVMINRDFRMSKGDVVRVFDNFFVVLKNPVYNLAYIANEIADQEARSCYFSNDGFMILYPDYEIRKDFASDGQSKVYIIKDKKTGKFLQMAIRGCVIPAGF